MTRARKRLIWLAAGPLLGDVAVFDSDPISPNVGWSSRGDRDQVVRVVTNT